jgi:hypothetical protein
MSLVDLAIDPAELPPEFRDCDSDPDSDFGEAMRIFGDDFREDLIQAMRDEGLSEAVVS